VNRVADDPDNATEENLFLLLFGIYLLAQFREAQALLPIIKLISLDGETVDWAIQSQRDYLKSWLLFAMIISNPLSNL